MWSATSITDTQQTALLAVNILSTGPGTAVDLTGYVGVLEVKLGIGAVSGTGSPTIVVTLETSDAIGSGFVTAKQMNNTNAAMSATAVGIDRLFLNAGNQRRYLRANVTTLSGSSPAFGTVCVLTGTKQVNP